MTEYIGINFGRFSGAGPQRENFSGGTKVNDGPPNLIGPPSLIEALAVESFFPRWV